MESPGLIFFKFEGEPYAVALDRDDPQFFSIHRPPFFKIKSDLELARAHQAVNAILEGGRVAKVLIDTSRGRDEIWAVARVETFAYHPNQITPNFSRMVRALATEVSAFIRLMQKG